MRIILEKDSGIQLTTIMLLAPEMTSADYMLLTYILPTGTAIDNGVGSQDGIIKIILDEVIELIAGYSTIIFN